MFLAVATPNRMKSPRRPEAKRKLPQKEKVSYVYNINSVVLPSWC